MITLRDAIVTYPNVGLRALDGVSLHVDRGDWIAVVGGNGSGKTTLLAAIGGLLPLSGGARVQAPGIRAAILLQEPDNQLVATSVRNELALSVPVDVPGSERAGRVRAAADRFALGALLDRNPHRLSGGEKQRLAAATVWLENPDVLLLDEPLAFLDAYARAQVVGFVRELNAGGVAVVWATPGGDEEALAGRVVRLERGRAVGTDAEPVRPRAAVVPESASLRRRDAAPTSHEPVLRFESVTFRYDGPTVLEAVDFSIAAGECVGLGGANGSGKSTFLLLAGGALSPEAGKVTRAAASDSALYLPQSPERLFFAETVQEEIVFGLRRRGMSAGRAADRADDAMRAVGLDPARVAGRSPFQLSAGEMRRVAFAIAVSLEPRVLLLDEPASGLDAEGCRVLEELVAEMSEGGAAVVVASHDPVHLRRVCHRVLAVEAGRVRESGPR